VRALAWSEIRRAPRVAPSPMQRSWGRWRRRVIVALSSLTSPAAITHDHAGGGGRDDPPTQPTLIPARATPFCSVRVSMLPCHHDRCQNLHHQDRHRELRSSAIAIATTTLPPPTAITTPPPPRLGPGGGMFGKMCGCMKSAGPTEAVCEGEDGVYTILAPTDAAFKALSDGPIDLPAARSATISLARKRSW